MGKIRVERKPAVESKMCSRLYFFTRRRSYKQLTESYEDEYFFKQGAGTMRWQFFSLLFIKKILDFAFLFSRECKETFVATRT